MTAPQRLHDLFSYDPLTGVLSWKVNKGRAKAGNHVKTVDGKGYLHVRIDGVAQRTHSVIWAMQTGRWPDGDKQVDHDNRVKLDNRWDNLLLKTASENKQNTGKYTTNTSGYLGVSWNKTKKKWTAQICVNYVTTRLGQFDTAEEASEAYQLAKKRLHPTVGA